MLAARSPQLAARSWQLVAYRLKFAARFPQPAARGRSLPLAAWSQLPAAGSLQPVARNPPLAAGGGPGQSAFLDLAAGLAAVMEEVDTVAIQSLRYTSERGGLSVTATYPDFSDFETFRAAAQARGLVIEEGGARQGDEGVTSDFLVRRS